MSAIRHLCIALSFLVAQAGAATPDSAAIRVPAVLVGQAGAGAGRDIDAVLQPQRQATVTAQLAGSILALHVKAGDAVRKGQVLVRLDDREMRANTARGDAAVAQAQAELRNAQQVLDRNRDLRNSGFISAAADPSHKQRTRSATAPAYASHAGAQSITLMGAPSRSRLPQIVPPPWMSWALIDETLVTPRTTVKGFSVAGSYTSVWIT